MTYQLFSRIINLKTIRSVLFNKVRELNDSYHPLKKYKWRDLEKNTIQLIQHRYYDLFKQQFERYISKYPNQKHTEKLVIKLIIFSFKYGHKPIIDYLQSHHVKYFDKHYDYLFSHLCSNGCLDMVEQYHTRVDIYTIFDGFVKASSGKHVEILRLLLNHMIKNGQLIEKFRNKMLTPVDVLVIDGHLELIKYLFNEIEKDGNQNLKTFLQPKASSISKADSNGHLNVIKYIFSVFNSNNMFRGVAVEAAENGQFDLIKFIDECIKRESSHRNDEKEFFNSTVMDNAAKAGELELVKWLHSNRTEGCTTSAMDYAAQNGHLEVLQWLHFNRTEGCTTNAMDWAAQNGHLSAMKFLNENRTEGCTQQAITFAIKKNQLEVLKFLYIIRAEYFGENLNPRIEGPLSLEMIKFIDKNISNFEWSASIMQYAARIGDLDSIKYLYKKENCKEFIRSTASKGRLNVAKWLHKNLKEDCTRNEYIFPDDLQNDDLSIIKYLEMGFKYTDEIIDLAVRNNNLEVVKYIVNKYPIFLYRESTIEAAAVHGSLEMIEFLFKSFGRKIIKFDLEKALESATLNGHYEFVKFLYEKTYDFLGDILEWASDSGQLAICEYVFNQ